MKVVPEIIVSILLLFMLIIKMAMRNDAVFRTAELSLLMISAACLALYSLVYNEEGGVWRAFSKLLSQ